ncbi:MAG: multidrug ABC transporter ATP-binding protein [Legionellales bacterium RIFCSPHIGHO2_12_FULL_35_11]|nr:MAG: multidrug ABC transporter ATP-binding protein [Legionellales bacterium RIFCSPHIGHO2_12_FULL_35_11]
MSAKEIIDVTDLVKSFNDRFVVNKISLKVNQGDVFGFLGPNGSGKTTTIRMLCGLLTPDSGKGTCLGYDILKESNKIKLNVGYMTQHFSFYKDLSVIENLNFFADIYGIRDKKARVAEIIEQHDLSLFRTELTGNLSGGWKQRVALAACLLHNPKLLLLDEPTAGIDPIARRIFWDKIHDLSEQGVTTLMSTHYMDEAERCTNLAYIAYGDIVIKGNVDEVINATNLITWNISGNITTKLLQEVKKIPAVTQASLFGRQIHACGYQSSLIEQGLEQLSSEYNIKYNLIDSTLEDAFISLVSREILC